MIDIQEKKRKILEFLKTSGPSLPVQIAKAIQMDPVFASAILSELLSSKEIKTSHMRIGASPLYLISGQENKLENKTEHLKKIEKETQEYLKTQKIIYDDKEEPATRVALRNIKDFAIPFKFQNKIAWKYAFTPEEEINEILFPKNHEKKLDIKTKKQNTKEEKHEVPKAWEIKKEEIKNAKIESKSTKPVQEKSEKIKNSHPKTFLKEIESFLKNQETSITEIEEVDKKKVIAIVKDNNQKSMLFAFNKARITETELLKCYKKADKKNLPYQIITKSSLTKKLTDTIRAYQKLLKTYELGN